MKAGFCKISFIPLRKEPSHKSEMISQIIFGELYTIIEESKEWIYIKNLYDGYEGWIDANQNFYISDEEFSRLQKMEVCYSADLYSFILKCNDNIETCLPFGSVLYGTELGIMDEKYQFKGKFIEVEKNIRLQIVNLSKRLIEVPYLWGGRTSFGIDCSGFTQLILKTCGIKLLRDASQQASLGKDVGFVNEAQEGDLAFFGDEENITHVGIVIEGGRIIHASGKVRIDKLDHHGIYNLETKKYSHKLRFIKNVID